LGGRVVALPPSLLGWGKKMLDTPISEFLGDQDLLKLSGDATVMEAAQAMADRHVGTVLVCEGDDLKGIITERDILERVVAQGNDPATTALKFVMTPDPVGITLDQSILAAVFSMRDQGTRHLVVKDGGKTAGILSVRDLLRSLVNQAMNDRKMVEDLWQGFPV